MIKENTMLIKKKRKIYDKYLRRFSSSNKWYVMTIILLSGILMLVGLVSIRVIIITIEQAIKTDINVKNLLLSITLPFIILLILILIIYFPCNRFFKVVICN